MFRGMNATAGARVPDFKEAIFGETVGVCEDNLLDWCDDIGRRSFHENGWEYFGTRVYALNNGETIVGSVRHSLSKWHG